MSKCCVSLAVYVSGAFSSQLTKQVNTTGKILYKWILEKVAKLQVAGDITFTLCPCPSNPPK
jgi:PII-like signaling protein